MSGVKQRDGGLLVCKYCMARTRASVAPYSHGFSWGRLIRKNMEEVQESHRETYKFLMKSRILLTL